MIYMYAKVVMLLKEKDKTRSGQTARLLGMRWAPCCKKKTLAE